MSLYPSLLQGILNASGAKGESPPVALLPADLNLGNPRPNADQGQIAFPTHILPEEFQKAHYHSIEEFLEKGEDLVQQNYSSAVFVAPPLIGQRRLPASWRQKHGNLDPSEVLADSLFQKREPSLFEQQEEIDMLILLVPSHFLRSASSSRWRQEFFARHAATIVEHDHLEILQQATWVNFATVILQRQPGPTKFFKVPADETITIDRITKDLKKLIKHPQGQTQFGYVYQDKLEINYPCSFDFYSQETEALRNQSSVLGEKVALHEIADVLMRYRPVIPHRPQGPRAIANFDYLRGRDITSDGRVNLDEVGHQTRLSEGVTFLQDGDFCLREISRTDPDSGLTVGIFEGDGRSIAIGPGMIVIRPKPLLSPEQRRVLLAYLRSSVAGKLAVIKGSRLGADLRIYPSMLRDYPVPVADKDLTSSLDAIHLAQTAFLQWADECQNAEEAIVRMHDATETRQEILAAGQLARQRHSAGKQVEDLDFRIRTQLPHPIAYLWRESQIGSDGAYSQFRDILKTAESTTCFLALLGIVMARESEKPIGALTTICGQLQRGSGTNFGNWFSIVEELNQKKFRSLPTAAPFSALTNFFSDPEVEAALRALMELRNDDSHTRIKHADFTQSDLAKTKDLLTTIFGALDFLTDYKLIQITVTKYDTLLKRTEFQYRDLTGDHPLPSVHTAESSRADLETDSLYMIDQNGEMHLFRPLLHYLKCPECHHLSTFFLDTYPGEGDKVSLKSFERGSIRKEPFAEHFQTIAKNAPLTRILADSHGL